MATSSGSGRPTRQEATGRGGNDRGTQPQLQVIHAAPAAIAMSTTSTFPHHGDISLLAPPHPNTYSRSSPDYHNRYPRRRLSLPFSVLQVAATGPAAAPATSSASLVPSTAQGHPIPLDHESTSNRTSALRELSSNYPSRHRYAKSTGAQNTTYSQPVIVRTYSGPASRPASSRGRHSSSRLRYPFSSVAPQSTPVVRNAGPGLLSSSMVHAKHLTRRKARSGTANDQPARLPPVDAFSFKSFLADAAIQNDIGSDLDRIAEICARSRYSLSNQYEVHMAPHGSGAAFLASQAPSRGGVAVGPTLQAVSSDDERGHRKRRSLARRRSAAYGTLETIISSSRSSEEDRQHQKKSAAEIAKEVRGRVSLQGSLGHASSSHDATLSGPLSGQDASTTQDKDTQDVSNDARQLAKKRSASFATAIMDSSRHATPALPSSTPGEPSLDVSSQKNFSGPLHSDPALPQTSSSHLEIRTTPEHNGNGVSHIRDPRPQSPTESQQSYDPLAPVGDELGNGQGTSILSTLGSWIPWGGVNAASSNGRRNGAEGSLRELLRHSESHSGKGKGVDRTYHF